MPEEFTWEAFEQHVQACLLHLYDYAFLQGDPLVRRLAPDKAGPDRVEAFRELVTEAIDRLRPGPNVDLHAKAGRSYKILTLRYLSQQPTQEVIRQLALSERQFYREHPKAIRAVSGILWEGLTGLPIPEVAEAPEITVDSEIQRIQAQTEPSRIDMFALLDKALIDVGALAEHHGVTLHFSPAGAAPRMDADRTMLRQAVLGILAHLITHAPGASLRLAVQGSALGSRLIFTLEGDALEPEALNVEAQAALNSLIRTLGGRVSHRAEAQRCMVQLELSVRQRTILVVDDNPDAVDLLQRYLIGQPYQIEGRRDGPTAILSARELQPDLIILDVMLPGQDGLEVLQNLKNHPATARIPVLVCSVLDMQDLALSLHADGYLRKPPGQAELLAVLASYTA